MVERYDALVIGGGMAGLPMALRAARHGRVAFVEKEKLGGTCLNRGCIPTKTMIASAAVAYQVRRAAEYGIRIPGPASVDLNAVVERKNAIVAPIPAGAYRSVEAADSLDFYPAEGRFTGPRRFTVDGTDLRADKIFLVTGMRTAIPAIDGLRDVPYHTSRTLLDLTDLPERPDRGRRRLHRLRIRPDVSPVRLHRHGHPTQPAAAALRGPGHLRRRRRRLHRRRHHRAHRHQLRRRVRRRRDHPRRMPRRRHRRFTGTHLLIAAGCTPNTDTLGLRHLNLDPDPDGFLPVDEHLRTSVEDVWALGDIRGGPMFTHTARDDADIVYRSVFRGQDRSSAGRIVPHAVFTDPEVGSVGMTEPAARAAGHQVVIGRQDFTGVVKARAIGNTRGLIKLVADAATGRILGCHIAGPDAGNLIHEVVIAMNSGSTYHDIAAAIHIHPTLAEGINAAAGGVHREIGTD